MCCTAYLIAACLSRLLTFPGQRAGASQEFRLLSYVTVLQGLIVSLRLIGEYRIFRHTYGIYQQEMLLDVRTDSFASQRHAHNASRLCAS